MTKNKRFILKENGVIEDTQLNILLDGGEDKEDMVDLLNDLSDENEQLKKEKQAIKNIISKLNNADYYLDSAILDEEIRKIATIVGEGYE